MNLKRYLSRVSDIVYSRQEIEVQNFHVDEVVPNHAGMIEGRFLFWNGSMLEFIEVIEERGVILVKTDYSYHYQDSENQLIFRYDNAPHHPEISTHPHHKHIFNFDTNLESIVKAYPPHLSDILREIDQYLYAI